MAWLAPNSSITSTHASTTVHKTLPSYLLLATSVTNSSVGQSLLRSPSSVDMIQTTGAAQVVRSQPSYLILSNSLGNSVGNSFQYQLKSPSGTSGSDSVLVVSRSTASSSSFLAVSGGSGGGSNLVLGSSGSQSSPRMVATVLLPATPLVRVVANSSAPPIQYILTSPTLSLQSPPNSVPVGNSQLSLPVDNSQAVLARQLGNTKLSVIQQSSSNCPPVGNSQLPIIQPSMVNSLSAVVQQTSSHCLLVGNSQLSGIVGIPASAAVQQTLGNCQSNVVQKLSPYYIPVGNSQSSNVVGIPVSLVNSAVPQFVVVGQTAIHPHPQIHSSSLVSVSQ